MEYTIDTLPSRLMLGHQTETGVNDIRIDMSEWLDRWPGLAISIWPTRPGETAAYPAVTVMDGNCVIWRVNSADTAIAGNGTVEIMGVADGKKALSKVMTTYIPRTTTGVTTEPPEAAKPWVDSVAVSAASAQEAAQRAEDAAGEIKGLSAAAQTLEAGAEATAEYADGVLTFGIPEGERGVAGEQGPKGEPGKDAVVDATLTQSGQAADAKVTGEAVAGKLDNTPGTWPEWTADEQAAARERMGLSGDYECISEITLEEDVTGINFSKAADGTPLSLKKFVVIVRGFPAEFGDGYLRIDAWSRARPNLFVKYLREDTMEDKYAFLSYEALSSSLFRICSGIQPRGANIFSNGKVDVNNFDYNGAPASDSVITQINVCKQISTDTLAAGIKISLYGVKA